MSLGEAPYILFEKKSIKMKEISTRVWADVSGCPIKERRRKKK